MAAEQGVVLRLGKVVCQVGDWHLPELGNVTFWDWQAYGGPLSSGYFFDRSE
jgi:hypothetical protein